MNFEIAQSYVLALTGDVNSVLDWRMIHDIKKDIPAHIFRGTLSQAWETLCKHNSEGYGIFCNINALDGHGKELANVDYIRAHVVDLDNLLTAQVNFENAMKNHPLPTFFVQSSPGKYHIYWTVQSYRDNDFYTLHQRKLRQIYDGDKSVIDPTRVLRVPGFLHLKNPQQPHLVTCAALNGYGRLIPASELAASLAHINVIDGGVGTRHQLGDPTMAAPSFELLKQALTLVDPNNLDRGEWISITAAVKQAGWILADNDTLFKMWSEWCALYTKNDLGENIKQWNSIRETEVGWKTIERKTAIKLYQVLGNTTFQQPNIVEQEPDKFKDVIEAHQCPEYFKNCYFVESVGEIFTSKGRFMNSTKFNGSYAGKLFVINNTGKSTDEPWKAALRSTMWTIPKVDHIRFLPDQPTFKIVEDELGRSGLNIYIPVKIKHKEGDVSLWLQHLEKMLPVASDREIIYDYLAHIVQYPGYKIPWSPLIQSTEGVGKTVIQETMTNILGSMYTHSPKAQDLVKSGSTFNAWMRNKLLIIVNEIKVDEKRELLEILKPLITEARIEIQRKGVDQEMEDNIANWFFFSNHKDAIPLDENGRRFAVFYSQVQTKNDKLLHGMDDAYFDRLWTWLRDEGGHQAIAHWLLNRPIGKGKIPKTAPLTSSYQEALKINRSPIEVVITNCVQDGLPGFRSGFISITAAITRVKAAGIRNPTQRTIEAVLARMGYIELGKAPRTYAQEDVVNRPILYGSISTLDVNNYGREQGYD